LAVRRTPTLVLELSIILVNLRQQKLVFDTSKWICFSGRLRWKVLSLRWRKPSSITAIERISESE